MNFRDVLLAVDGLDIEKRKNLDDIRNMLQSKISNMVQLTFLNKEWFNIYDRDSIKKLLKNRKGGKQYTVFWLNHYCNLFSITPLFWKPFLQ